MTVPIDALIDMFSSATRRKSKVNERRKSKSRPRRPSDVSIHFPYESSIPDTGDFKSVSRQAEDKRRVRDNVDKFFGSKEFKKSLKLRPKSHVKMGADKGGFRIDITRDKKKLKSGEVRIEGPFQPPSRRKRKMEKKKEKPRGLLNTEWEA